MSRLDDLLARWAAPLAALCLMAGLLIGYDQAGWLPGAAACGLAGAGALLHRGRMRRISLLALMLTVGIVWGYAAQHPALPLEGDYVVSAVVSDTVQQRTADGQVHTLLHHVTLDGKPLLSGAYWSFYADAVPEGLSPGAHVAFTARLYHPKGADNPGGYDFRLNLLQKGVTIGLYGGQDTLQCDTDAFCLFGLMAGWRHALSQGLCSMLSPESGAYASAMLLGERSLLAEEDITAFQRMGIAHVLSVSGYHVGVLAALLLGLLRLLRVPRRCHLIPMSVLLTGYCLLTGLHPPVIRASILVMLGLYGMQLGATPLRLHWLALAAIVQLLVSPIQLLSASFQLTYCALLGVILVTGFLRRRYRSHARRRWRSSLFMALGAQLGVLLPQLYWFHELPALGLIANPLLLGVISLLMGLYWLCLPLMLIPGLSAAYGALLSGVTAAFSSFIRTVSKAAGVMLWTRQADLLTALGWVIMLAAINPFWRRWGRKQLCAALAGLIVLVCSVLPWPSHGVTYTQLSVGEADAAVIQDDDTVFVIDTGEDSTLAQYLHAHRLSIDTLVLTHLHTDHTGGLSALLESGIPIRRCILPAEALSHQPDESIPPLLDELRSHGTVISYASRGDVLTLPHGELTVLWPEAGRVRANQSANDYCLALLARLHSTTLLLTGDLSGTYEGYAAVPADILKAAHHGSATSTGADFLAAVQPQAVLQSCGSSTRAEAFAARLSGIPVYATQRCGAITLMINETGCTLQPYLP